ncbi:MAG: hypothetical protein WDW36_008574 [Sanguina aurantia]
MEEDGLSYVSLLQELLLSLIGFNGDVFVQTSEADAEEDAVLSSPPSECRTHLSPDLHWIPEPERQLLNEICRLGSHYQAIQHFISLEGPLCQVQRRQPQPTASHPQPSQPSSATPHTHPVQVSSMYRRALVTGLTEIMDVYRSAVLQVQQEMLHSHAIPVLASIQYFLTDFTVLYNELPIHVTPELADTIAFVGRAVRMLKTRAAGFTGQDLLPFKDALECAASIQQLQQEAVFNKSAFERTVEMIRAKVAGVLWDLLVVQAGLMSQLAAIKDYFLLARGDFYQSFLTDSRRLMALPPRAATVDTDIDGLFQAAGQKSSAATDRLFSLFRMRFTPGTAQAFPGGLTLGPLSLYTALDARLPQGALSNTLQAAVAPSLCNVPRFDPNWDPIHLEYKGEWPLGLLITPAHLGKYNALMQFLLRLKRVQLKMDAAWQSLGTKQLRQGLGRGTRTRQMHSEDSAAGTPGAGGATLALASLRQLRYHMAHLVNNLAIYIQTDVIESNYKVLEERIEAAHDFSEAERAHHLYLHNLMDQSFLTSKTICTLISTVFGHVQDLCTVIESADQARESGAPGRINFVRVAEIDKAFFRTVGSLYVNLNSQKLQEANRAPHLRQLYMRLDYNHFLIHYTMPKQ